MVITVRRQGTAIYAVAVCLSPPITRQYYTKTVKHRITQTMPHDSPGSLVFWSQRSLVN